MPLDNTGASAHAELAAINRELEAAAIVRDEARRAVDRLEKPTALLAEAIREHAAEKAAHDAAVVVWYEGGAIGSRPAPSPSMLELERRIGELRQDVGASDNALEAANDALDAQNARLGSLAVQKASATYRAAAEAAKQYLQRECRPAMIESLRRLSAVESLVAELSRLGMREPEALSAGREIEQQIREMRQSLAVRGDLALAGEFLNCLGRDPEAVLTAPHHIHVEHIDPRVIRPAEDGTGT